MPIWPADYIENVLKDVEKYNGVRKITKAGLLERCFIKHIHPAKLHPNPEDEFSQEAIGPNMGIIGQYVEQIKLDEGRELPIFAEPVIVQKMLPDGYLLLNGHHRWFAALRMGVKRLTIQIVNLVSEEDLKRMISNTSNERLVSFDLDEVLLTTEISNQAEIRDSLFSKKIKERLRKGVPEIIKILQSKGYDVCVYSAGYLSEEDINDFFSMYEVKVDIILNGFNEKRKNNNARGTKDIRRLMDEKYKNVLHIDNYSVLYTNHITKAYKQFEIDGDWYESIKDIVSRNSD